MSPFFWPRPKFADTQVSREEMIHVLVENDARTSDDFQHSILAITENKK